MPRTTTTDQSESTAAEPVPLTPARRRPLASPAWSMVEGRVIDNAISGERIVIRKSGAQTGGRVLAFDLFLPPGGHVPAGHVHPVQEERFTVVAGRMRFRLGRRTILASPGETVRVPPGTAHWFGNDGAEVALTRVTVRPALRMEELLHRTGRLGMHGTYLPRLSELALVLTEFQHELAVPNVPAFVVRVVVAPLAWLARRRAAPAALTRWP
jgi:quercetin dioxygenase-like cupin family protein